MAPGIVLVVALFWLVIIFYALHLLGRLAQHTKAIASALERLITESDRGQRR